MNVTDRQAMYLVCQGGETISEVVKFTPEFGSWLIGNTVQKGKSAKNFMDGLILLNTSLPIWPPSHDATRIWAGLS